MGGNGLAPNLGGLAFELRERARDDLRLDLQSEVAAELLGVRSGLAVGRRDREDPGLGVERGAAERLHRNIRSSRGLVTP